MIKQDKILLPRDNDIITNINNYVSCSTIGNSNIVGGNKSSHHIISSKMLSSKNIITKMIYKENRINKNDNNRKEVRN